MTEKTVQGRWAPFAAALRGEFAGELAGPLACCEPGADVMFEHDGPCSLMEGPEVVQVGAVGVTPADIMAFDPEVASSQWWHEELQFAAHGEIFELSVQGEVLRLYTNGTRHRPEQEVQLESIEPVAVAAEIHGWVSAWRGACPLPDLQGYDLRNPLRDDVQWVWQWWPLGVLRGQPDGNVWVLHSRAQWLCRGTEPLVPKGIAPAHATTSVLQRFAEQITGDRVIALTDAEPYVQRAAESGKGAWVRVVHVRVLRSAPQQP